MKMFFGIILPASKADSGMYCGVRRGESVGIPGRMICSFAGAEATCHCLPYLHVQEAAVQCVSTTGTGAAAGGCVKSLTTLRMAMSFIKVVPNFPCNPCPYMQRFSKGIMLGAVKG